MLRTSTTKSKRDETPLTERINSWRSLPCSWSQLYQGHMQACASFSGLPKVEDSAGRGKESNRYNSLNQNWFIAHPGSYILEMCVLVLPCPREIVVWNWKGFTTHTILYWTLELQAGHCFCDYYRRDPFPVAYRAGGSRGWLTSIPGKWSVRKSQKMYCPWGSLSEICGLPVDRCLCRCSSSSNPIIRRSGLLPLSDTSSISSSKTPIILIGFPCNKKNFSHNDFNSQVSLQYPLASNMPMCLWNVAC